MQLKGTGLAVSQQGADASSRPSSEHEQILEADCTEAPMLLLFVASAG